MKIPNDVDFDRYQWEDAIDRWIFDEEHHEADRKIYFDMLEKLNRK